MSKSIRIHYIGNYVKGINDRNLFGFQSAISKMTYIVSALKRANYSVVVYATGETQNRFFCYYPSKIVTIDNKEKIVYLNTFGTPFYLFKVLSRLWTWVQMVSYFLFNVKPSDIVLIYHSPLYKWPLKIATFFKKLNLYYEVDEIYTATMYKNQAKIDKEIRSLRFADGYILVNDLMSDLIKIKNKPYVVCYGDYSSKYVVKQKKTSGEIRLVYAGLIGNQNWDAFLAIETMQYLPSIYQLDIAGYGYDSDINRLKERIDEINKLLGREDIVFHGLLSGDEYFHFLSKCNIGLCTRVLPDNLSEFTFPSKVLVYLGSNVIPICSPLTCIKNSKIENFVIFCNDVNAKAIAEAILSVDISNKKNNNVLKELDNQFIIDLKNLFKISN